MDGSVFSVVRDGFVDYDALRSDQLDRALQAVAEATIPQDRDEAYAFLINAYNITVLDAVRRRLYRDGKQIGSLRNPFTWLRFFLLTPVTVAGRRISLYGLEFRMIRPHLDRDPRGHFALVCASTGCPPLKDGLFHGDRLDEELEMAGRAFLQGARLDRDDHVLWLNRIFKWYRRDFDAMGGLHRVYARYAAQDDASWVMAHRPKIRFLRYDWGLNIASAAQQEQQEE